MIPGAIVYHHRPDTGDTIATAPVVMLCMIYTSYPSSAGRPERSEREAQRAERVAAFPRAHPTPDGTWRSRGPLSDPPMVPATTRGGPLPRLTKGAPPA